MTMKQLEAFRQQLLKLERGCHGDVVTLEDETLHNTDGMAVGNLSNEPIEDRADLASDNYCEETTIGLAEHAVVREKEINAALQRIEDGTFGNCAGCGREISKNRLRAVPFVRQCVDCARRAERGDAPVPGNL